MKATGQGASPVQQALDLRPRQAELARQLLLREALLVVPDGKTGEQLVLVTVEVVPSALELMV